MRFTEVQNHDLFDKGRWWMPHAVRMALREGDDPQAYIWEALRGENRIFVFWNSEGHSTGACATRVQVRHDGVRTGEFYWMAGTGLIAALPEWLPRLERILARDHNITRFRVAGRNGWAGALSPHGYCRVKVILEKGVDR